MKSWGELWLNEGFATYFENIGGTIAKPNMAYLETFFSGLATTALSSDALTKSTHPLADLTGKLSMIIKDLRHSSSLQTVYSVAILSR